MSNNQYCPFCGSITKQGDVYCLNCGARMEEDAPFQSSTTVGTYQQSQPTQVQYPQQHAYHAPPTYTPAQPVQSNWAANLSLIAAIIGIFIMPVIGSLLAVIFGFIGLTYETEKAKAGIGLTLGLCELIGIALLVVWVVLWL